MKRWSWLLLALILVSGCSATKPAEDRAVSTVQNWRRTSNSLSIAALMDLKVAERVAQQQSVTSREWSATRNGNTWTVSCDVHTSRGDLLGQWTLEEESGQVEPANDLAHSLDAYEKQMMARLAPTPVQAVALATPQPLSASAVPVPTVTVTVTATPPPVAISSSAPSPVAVVAPPPPPPALPPSAATSDIELQGVMHLGGVPVAMMRVKGQPYEGHLGDNIAGYKITRIGDRDITVDDHGRPIVIALAPSDGVAHFNPAPEQTKAPMTAPSVVNPSEIQTH